MRLIVMRHAKSSWDDAGTGDHARPLNARGRRAAAVVARRLSQLGWAPRFVLSSDATRTRETYERMREVLSPAPEVVTFRRDLYLAGADTALEALAELPPAADAVLLLGHNPGWEELAARLCGEPVSLTTGNAVLCENAGETWPEALRMPWRCVAVLRPRELEGV